MDEYVVPAVVVLIYFAAIGGVARFFAKMPIDD